MSHKCNVLMLHGFRMNGEMMRQMLADVIEATQHVANWHFVDAPLAATGPASPFIRRRFRGLPCFEWWNAMERAEGTVSYQGLEYSLQRASDVLAQRRFDVVAGYSQGAAMTAILTAMLETGRLKTHAGWHAAVLFNSGPPPRDPMVAGWFDLPLRTPSLHVLGGPSDTTHQWQGPMCEMWSPAVRTKVEHQQGHTPPGNTQSPEALSALVRWFEAQSTH